MKYKIYWIVGAIFVIAGTMIVGFPVLKQKREDNIQQQMLKDWYTAFAYNIDDTQDNMQREEAEEVSHKHTSDSDGVIAVMRIPKIDLEQPVLDRATVQNLNVSLAAIAPTGAVGEVGNFAVAGHFSRKYGRHFNRLQELEEGDEIIVDTEKTSCTYIVTGTFVVEKEDIWVLEPTTDKAEITLVTCYYTTPKTPQRYVVKGVKK